VKREKLSKSLNIPERYEILLVVALGARRETVVLEEVSNNDIKYWRDEKGAHHVPKRSLSEIILDL
jgi:hypothetical protein